MTRAERIFAVIAAVTLPLVFVLPVGAVEIVLTLEVLIVSALAIPAGLYIRRAGMIPNLRDVALYLWLLVRRNERVTVAFAMLLVFILAVLGPRILATLGAVPEGTVWVSRPWGTVWLAIVLNLFAVGLYDDALQMRADRRLAPILDTPAPPAGADPRDAQFEETL